MSSPIGGFYLAALDRDKRAKFKLASRTRIKLCLRFNVEQNDLIDEAKIIYCEESATFENSSVKVSVFAKVKSTQLLEVTCSFERKNGVIDNEGLDNEGLDKESFDCEFMGGQTVNLEPEESLTTMVDANPNIKLIISAAPF